jgi:hypothetical protein
LRAITGIITFSSKLPLAPPQVTAASLPITWAATCITISGITGLTFAGMIDDPGLDLGQRISAMPVTGPDPSQRRSLAILNSAWRRSCRAPEASTTASLAPWASKWFVGLPERIAGALGAISAITSAAKPRGR